MLWYKGWLETRVRLVFVLGMLVFVLAMYHSRGPATAHARQTALYALLGISIPSMMVAVCAILAGAGINTQAPFQATRGMHGSTLYTLSLPVSRLRLLAVRAGLGWLELVGATAFFCCATWAVSPVVGELVAGNTMLEYTITLVACTSALYFLSVLLGTVLDDLWRVWGTMLTGAAVAWLSGRVALPEFADLFRAIGEGGPAIAHTIPWGAMGFAVGLSAVLFAAALKVAQAREY